MQSQQQQQLLQQQQHHFIHNYMETSDTNSLTFDDWKTKAQQLTKDMVIVEWSTYRSPLKTLGPMGKYVMQLSSLSPFLFLIR